MEPCSNRRRTLTTNIVITAAAVVMLASSAFIPLANAKPTTTNKHKIGDDLPVIRPFDHHPQPQPSLERTNDDYYDSAANPGRPPPPPPRRRRPPPPLPSVSKKSPTATTAATKKNNYPSTLQIPLQVAKDVNAMVRVGYWSTRAVILNYLNKINSITNHHHHHQDRVDVDHNSSAADSDSSPTTLVETLYTLLV